MDSNKQSHKITLSLLHDYLEKTAAADFQKDIQEISEMDCAGPTAFEYFAKFHEYYLGVEEDSGKPSASEKKRKVRRSKVFASKMV